jgi:hypothetical protein
MICTAPWCNRILLKRKEIVDEMLLVFLVKYQDDLKIDKDGSVCDHWQ